MFSAKGYSVNVNVPLEQLGTIRELVSYLTSSEIQEKMAVQLATTPVDRAVLASPAIRYNPALVASMEQIAHGRPMPIVPQIRQLWEGNARTVSARDERGHQRERSGSRRRTSRTAICSIQYDLPRTADSSSKDNQGSSPPSY